MPIVGFEKDTDKATRFGLNDGHTLSAIGQLKLVRHQSPRASVPGGQGHALATPVESPPMRRWQATMKSRYDDALSSAMVQSSCTRSYCTQFRRFRNHSGFVTDFPIEASATDTSLASLRIHRATGCSEVAHMQDRFADSLPRPIAQSPWST